MNIITMMFVVTLLLSQGSLSISYPRHGKRYLSMKLNSRFLISTAVGISVMLPNPSHSRDNRAVTSPATVTAKAKATAKATSSDIVVDHSSGSDVKKVDRVSMKSQKRMWIDFIGRLTDMETTVDQLEDDVKIIIKDLADSKIQFFFISIGTTTFILGTTLFILVKMDADRKELIRRMDADKEESSKRMDKTDSRMMVMFIITSGISIAAFLK